jgi:hypothetical protein
MDESRHNPYSPPKADVSEPAEPALAEAPPAVTRAVRLLWFSFVLTFVEIALDWEAQIGGVSLVYLLVWMGVMCALQVWLYLKIARGRNWARITFLVLIAITLPVSFTSILEMAQRAPVAAGVTLIDLFVVFFALYLLFFPGRSWFRR